MSLDAAFKLLGLDRGMEDGSIDADAKKAYRRLAQKAHPDKGGSTEEFQRLGEAYERVCSRNESPFSGMGGMGGMGGGADMEEMLECDVKIASKEDRRRIVAAAARLREKQG